MKDATTLVVENVYASVLVSAGSVLAVSAEIDTHTEASTARASRFQISKLRSLLIGDVEDTNSAVVGRDGEERAVFAQGKGPNLTSLRGRSCNFTTKDPFVGICV